MCPAQTAPCSRPGAKRVATAPTRSSRCATRRFVRHTPVAAFVGHRRTSAHSKRARVTASTQRTSPRSLLRDDRRAIGYRQLRAMERSRKGSRVCAGRTARAIVRTPAVARSRPGEGCAGAGPPDMARAAGPGRCCRRSHGRECSMRRAASKRASRLKAQLAHQRSRSPIYIRTARLARLRSTGSRAEACCTTRLPLDAYSGHVGLVTAPHR